MPLNQREIYLRRRFTVFGGLAAALAAAFYLPLTLLAPLTPVDAVVQPYAAPTQPASAPTMPSFGASAIGAVGFPGLLANAGSTDPLPIASITKVVTALVVLDAKPLGAGEQGPEITMTNVDEGFYDAQLALNGSIKPVHSGQVITQFQLLEVVLIASANNYAQSLATWAFGSEGDFLAATRAWLDRNGLVHTTVTDPTGVQPSNTSSVADLIEIAKLAVANPVVAAITATASADVPEVGAVANTNHLLGIDGVDGIKTGTLDEAGACLLFSADYPVGGQTVTIVGVALGGPDHPTVDASVKSLLESALPGFHEVTLAVDGEEFGSYETDWGDTAGAVAATEQVAITWSNTPVSVLVHLEQVSTAEAGTDVGDATFTVGDQSMTINLVLDRTIDDPGPWWRLGNPALLF
jgi:D-alanyl-D-alanine carboxypeptidase (penicillin-binding protein 5/6)